MKNASEGDKYLGGVGWGSGPVYQRDFYISLPTSMITFHESAINKDALHLVLSRKRTGNRELILIFNEGLNRLKQSGRYDEILQSVTQMHGIE